MFSQRAKEMETGVRAWDVSTQVCGGMDKGSRFGGRFGAAQDQGSLSKRCGMGQRCSAALSLEIRRECKAATRGLFTGPLTCP